MEMNRPRRAKQLHKRTKTAIKKMVKTQFVNYYKAIVIDPTWFDKNMDVCTYKTKQKVE